MTSAQGGSDDAKTSAICAGALGAVFALIALAVYDGRTAMSVAIGAAIGVLNLLTMRAIVRALIQPPPEEEKKDEGGDAKEAEGEATPKEKPDHRGEGRRGGAAWGVFAVLKMFLLFGGIYVLLTKNLVDPIPMVVGYGVLPLGIALSTVVASLRPRRR
jgi:hypothetical protein